VIAAPPRRTTAARTCWTSGRRRSRPAGRDQQQPQLVNGGGELDLLDLLIAAGRGEVVIIPAPLRQLIRVPDGFSHIVRLPVTALLRTLRLRPPAE